ncbi:hypothetical protein [Pseudooceanicola sp. MF1-13]|uniref:DUF7716 domain-containing protein n=1 Tax=Pseudooceanicola sp. MF1-13 TaxID=3379095 RepID=UPI003892772A
MILDSEAADWDEDRDMAVLAVQHGLAQTIEAYDIGSVALHLQDLRGTYSRADLIAALDHYIRNDAFLT